MNHILQLIDIVGNDLVVGVVFAISLSILAMMNYISNAIVRKSIIYERTGIEDQTSMVSRIAHKLTLGGSDDYLKQRKNFLRTHFVINIACFASILLFTWLELAIVTVAVFACIFSNMLYGVRKRGYSENTVEHLVERIDTSQSRDKELERLYSEMNDFKLYNEDAFVEFLTCLAGRDDNTAGKAKEILTTKYGT